MLKCETNMLQDLTEFKRFSELIISNGIKSFLEIGSKHGGTFWRVTNLLPKGSRAVSVDLPEGYYKATSEFNLKACVNELKRTGYDAHLFIGDSTNLTIVNEVRKLGPFDLIFIDGNHSEPYVRKDWANYGPMGKMIAFHDIAWKFLPHKSDAKRLPISVPKVWEEIKKGYEHLEISNCVASNGIGVLWRERPC